MKVIDQTTEHAADIERLLDRAFGPGRNGKTVYRLRDGLPPAPGFSFVIERIGVDRASDRSRESARHDKAGADSSGPERDGALAATLRFWPVALPARGRALLLGPIAVQPALSGQGFGRALIRHGIARARAEGWPAILLVDDEPYYGPFGFSREAAEKLRLPGPVDEARFLAMALIPGALDGIEGTVGRVEAPAGAN